MKAYTYNNSFLIFKTLPSFHDSPLVSMVNLLGLSPKYTKTNEKKKFNRIYINNDNNYGWRS